MDVQIPTILHPDRKKLIMAALDEFSKRLSDTVPAPVPGKEN